MDLYYEVKVLSHMIKRKIEQSEEYRYLDSLTCSAGCIIGYIAKAGGEAFQKDVETGFSIRRSTVSKMLQSLEEMGLIVREGVDYDARLKKIILTESGWNMHNAVVQVIDRTNAQAISGIDKEELDAFFKTLEKMKNNLSDIKD